MADIYARISGVVPAQDGPMATLLAEALQAAIPIVAPVQEVTQAAADRHAPRRLLSRLSSSC
jgi:thiamine pyrophosphate-dependent acetolactate synthase large subunit-like protein